MLLEEIDFETGIERTCVRPGLTLKREGKGSKGRKWPPIP